MSKLPPTWASTTLGLVSKITTGNTPSTKISSYFGGGYPFVKPGDLDRRVPIVETAQTLSDAGAANARLVRPGAVLVSCIGNLGKIGIAGKPLATNQQINAVEFHANMVDDRYGYYSCCTLKTWMEQSASATTVSILNKGRFSFAPIDIAPLAEQKRIANQLDILLARVKSCNDHFDAVPALLKRFRQAVLTAATKGELTAEWRSAPSRENWIECNIGQMLNGKPRNGYSPQAVDYETPVRSLTLSATTSGKFLARHSKFIAEPIAVDSHLWLEPGDILIQRANSLEYVGVSAIFDGEEKQFIYPDLMMKCRPNDQVKNKFLFYALSAKSTRTYFRDNATGTAGNMPKINQQTVMSTPLLLPPLEEQTEIISRVEALFALADRIEARCTTARAQAQRLMPLVLAKAFRGELVPQDPSDEPASALLARMAAQKTSVLDKKAPVDLKKRA